VQVYKGGRQIPSQRAVFVLGPINILDNPENFALTADMPEVNSLQGLPRLNDLRNMPIVH